MNERWNTINFTLEWSAPLYGEGVSHFYIAIAFIALPPRADALA
jgi:hypothetical protein